MPKIIVLGEAVTDLIFQLKKMPAYREVVTAEQFQTSPGGKALNQSIAAARQGADVSLITKVGADKEGKRIIETLKKEGVSTKFVAKDGKTGVVAVFTNPAGGKAFINWNGFVGGPSLIFQIKRAKHAIAEADALLITFGASFEAIKLAIDIAKTGKPKIFLNPAPVVSIPFPKTYLKKVDFLIPNITEAVTLLGKGTSNPKAPAQQLYRLGVKFACITAGARGCTVASANRVKIYAPYKVTVKDATGCSDAFCASLAVSISEGRSLDKSIGRANAAAACAAKKFGSYNSMPTVREIERLIKSGRK